MVDLIISIIVYALFGLIGIFLLKKINFVKKTFNNKQNIIYLSIFFIVFGFFIGNFDVENVGYRSERIAYQIGYGLGNYASCFVGAVIATFLAMKFKFSFKNKLFYYSLFGSISLGMILFLIAILIMQS